LSRLLPLLLGLAFPLLAHASVMTDCAGLAVLATLCLALFLLWPLRQRLSLIAVLLAALVAVLWLLWQRGAAHLPLLLPPIMITAAVGSYFARSLKSGSVPLIERVVRAVYQGAPIKPAVIAYVRRLTWAWAALLYALSAICAVLALLATPGGLLMAVGITPAWTVPMPLWSLFANLINYLVIGLFFVGEYLYRRWRFPEPPPYRNFAGFLKRVGQLGPTFWRRDS
jgi:uncharacterized membrane protein